MLAGRRYRGKGANGELSSREVRHGVALRAVSCRTRGEEEFFLDVRCLHDAALEGDITLRAHGERGLTAHCVLRASSDVRLPAGCDAWVESQFIVRFPAAMRTLYVDCVSMSSGAVLCRQRFEYGFWHDRLLREFYAQACNPFADAWYPQWLDAHRASDETLEAQRETRFGFEPLVSLVVPVYRTPPSFLRAMLDSVIAQSYANWELVVVNASPDDDGVAETLASYDDARIVVLDHPENDGINGNTNFGIAHSRGDYVGFLDHDDFIESDLLFEYVCAINRHDRPSMLYCDEDSFSMRDGFVLPMFKPDMNIDLLYSNNYLLHLLMVSRDVIEHVTCAPDQANGAQDYDLTLKAYEHSRRVVHVPRVLYHWRIHEASSNAGNDVAKPYVNDGCKAALDAHFAREGLEAHAQDTDVPYVYRCVPEDSRPVACACVLADDVASRNLLAREADTELVLLGASDIAGIEPGKLETLGAYFLREDMGVLAPRLICPDGLSCTQWLVLRQDGSLTHMGHDLPALDGGYNGRFHRPCDVTAVDGSCMVVRREDFLALGAYDESFQTLEYACVDLCLRYRQDGKLVAFTPFVSLEHGQPIIDTIMGRPDAWSQAAKHDRELLNERWSQLYAQGDPLLNPNLDQASPYFVLGH